MTQVAYLIKLPPLPHLDWTLPPTPGPAFENLVAIHLIKWVHFRQDTEGLDLELRYFRDVDGREVDFVVTDRRKPILIVEAKLGIVTAGYRVAGSGARRRSSISRRIPSTMASTTTRPLSRVARVASP